MWSPVISPPDVPDDKVPVSRCKHATVLHGQCLYLLGGRNGNLPMKDFWKYCIGKQNLNLNCLQYDKFPNLIKMLSVNIYIYIICISADNQWYQLETKGASDFPGCLQVQNKSID